MAESITGFQRFFGQGSRYCKELVLSSGGRIMLINIMVENLSSSSLVTCGRK